MNAVLLSVKPQWCAKIFSGEKTYELRRTFPHDHLPIKCYVYCTQARSAVGRKCKMLDNIFGGGMVVGEFTVDSFQCINPVFDVYRYGDYPEYFASEGLLKKSCLTKELFDGYCHKNDSIRPVYFWHISNVKRYDGYENYIPLNRFVKSSDESRKNLDKPPMSWMYVEDLDDGQE